MGLTLWSIQKALPARRAAFTLLLLGHFASGPTARASDMPPFKLDHPICPGGFWIAQRYDDRNAAGTIIKSVWVRKCTKGRIVYGRKV